MLFLLLKSPTNMLLSGVKILITRAAHQSKEFGEKLARLGATPIEMSVIEIHPPDSWDELDNAIRQLHNYQWVILASSNAVRSYASRLNMVIDRLSKQAPRLAVIGKNTETIAYAEGLSVDYKPDQFIAESFVEQFPDYPNLANIKILWPRTNVGRDYIAEKLREAGAQIDIVSAYKTCLPADIATLSEYLHKLIAEKQIDAITIASSQTAINLAAVISYSWACLENSDDRSRDFSQRISNLLQNITVLSIGPETSSSARKHLGKVDLEASPHNIDGMLSALIRHFQHTNDIVVS